MIKRMIFKELDQNVTIQILSLIFAKKQKKKNNDNKLFKLKVKLFYYKIIIFS